jgi:integrase
MKSFLLVKKDKKTYWESIATHAPSSIAAYKSVVSRLEEFCRERYDGRTGNDIIKELRSIPAEQRDDAFYGVLQGYVNWLMRRKLSHKTVNNHFKVIKHYFSYYGLRADPIGLRQNINRPKEIKEKLHPLTVEEIHKIFAHTIEKRRMLYLVLIGSGMRIRECVALRKRDFDLDYPKRIKIDIPAQFTKTKTAHATFVSKEASIFLLPHLKRLATEDLVFSTNPEPYHASMTEIEAFTRYRDAAGLTAKYESANRHHITLHSFRSYFFTRARRVHDTDIAHAMVGHTPYLDMYDRKDDLEKLQLYVRVEPSLRIDWKGENHS